VKVEVQLSLLQGNLMTNQGHKMSDRQNKLMWVFDLRGPRITAFQILEWISEKMKQRENDMRMIQILARGETPS